MLTQTTNGTAMLTGRRCDRKFKLPEHEAAWVEYSLAANTFKKGALQATMKAAWWPGPSACREHLPARQHHYDVGASSSTHGYEGMTETLGSDIYLHIRTPTIRTAIRRTRGW